MQTMQFRVVIPSNVKENQIIRIRCPDGTEGDVKVPKGLKSGDSFVFEMPDAESERPTEIKGFLDREIVNMQDFIMALVVGLFIGLSIIGGFLLGVLTVTDQNIHSTKGFKVSPLIADMQEQPQMRMPQIEL